VHRTITASFDRGAAHAKEKGRRRAPLLSPSRPPLTTLFRSSALILTLIAPFSTFYSPTDTSLPCIPPSCSETLSESSSLPPSSRSLAALVASKVYYHLGAYDEALQLALAAGDRFELERTQVLDGKGKAGEGYIEVIIGQSYLFLTFSSSALPRCHGVPPTRADQALRPLQPTVLTPTSRRDPPPRPLPPPPPPPSTLGSSPLSRPSSLAASP
jgi:hypothetical protein